MSTFEKEATKTHLQTNYFQALTIGQWPINCKLWVREVPPQKRSFLDRGVGWGGGAGLLRWRLQRQESQLEKLVCSNNEKRLSGEMKKKTCWHIFPHLPVHIFTFLILWKNDKLSVWQPTTPISFSTHRWDFKGKNTFSPFPCPISPLFHYAVTLWKVMELLLLNKSCSYWRLSRGLHR